LFAWLWIYFISTGLRSNEITGIINDKTPMQTSFTFLLLSVIIILSLVGCAFHPNPSSPVAPTSFPGPTPTALPILDTIKGSFRNQIGILENNMPRSKSEGYVRPTYGEQTDFADLVSVIFTKDLGRGADLATKDHYTLSYYVDRGDDYAVSYLLREQRPIQKGWGLYAFRLNSTSDIIIEAPHPLYDKRSPSVALDLYRALDARALLIAGAHRNADRDKSSDVAHATESIFQSVHIALSRELQKLSGDVIVLQIHGFHSSNHEGYPQVVFGLGEKPLPKEVAIAQKIKDALSKKGITAGICAGDGSEYEDLCAKKNVQAAVMEEGAFIHIELDENIRQNDDAFIAVLVEVFSN
jgi:hypothetical protein